MNHPREGGSKGSVQPKADAEEEEDPEQGVPLTQSSGSGVDSAKGPEFLLHSFSHVESCRRPLCCIGSSGKVKTESSTLDRTRLL